MTPNKQIVYFAKKETAILTHNMDGYDKKEGYFFTPEQLNRYTTNVIKQALETAAEEAEVVEGWNTGFSGNAATVNKQSITNTFDETFKKFEV